MRTQRSIIVSLLILLLCPVAVRADGLDLSFLSRFGDRNSILETLALDVLFMAINYALNFLFVGFLAIRFGKIAFGIMALDILLFTLCGQLADRFGAIVAGIVAGPEIAHSVYGHPLDWLLAGLYFVLNFTMSALAIGALTLLFGYWRWHLSIKARWGIAILAAIFTNPAYVMIIETLHYQKFIASVLS